MKNIINQTISILMAVSLFKNFDLEQITKIRNICVDKYYPKGGIIFIEGDKAKGFFIIITGSVKIFKISIDGKEKILNIYGPGNLFAETTVFDNNRFPASAISLNQSHILLIPKTIFIELVRDNPFYQ